MGVLLEKMVLDGPDVGKAQLVGEADLFEPVEIHRALGLTVPGARDG